MKAVKLFICALQFLIICSFGVVQAQTGVVRGSLNDAVTGEALIGATVIIKGTTIGSSTDMDGRYVIRNAPVGEHILVFSYIGYQPVEREIVLESGQTLVEDAELSNTTIQGEEVTVTARQRGQARALSEQRTSTNIKNVISSEQIEAFADNTVTSALSRIAGMGHGGANIRGVGVGATNVTMDGQRMGATGGDRSVDLSTISADMVQDLEVIKVITPDMDADALAGVINVNTRRPVGGERNANIRVGGGVQDRYYRFSGSQQRASVSYGDSPNDNYSFGVNFSYQRDPSASEGLYTEWDSRSFQSEGDSTREFLSDIGTELEFDVRERFGTGLQFTFQPNERSTYHVQGLVNIQNRTTKSYGISYNPRTENYTTPYQTGYPDGGGGPNAANQSTIGYNPSLDKSTTQQYTLQAGGRHRLDNMDIEYSVGWGHGRFIGDEYQMDFETFSRHEFTFNIDDRWSPAVEVAPWSLNPQYPLPSQMIFQEMDHLVTNSTDNHIEGKIDFVIPVELGEIKFGASSRLSYKNGVEERLLREYSSRLDVSTFQLIENGSWQIFDRSHQTYQIPWLIDLEKAREFYISQTPRFTTDLDEWALATETSRYLANENTHAVFVMGEFKKSFFTLLTGLRVENTYNHYTGRQALIDGSEEFRGARDIVSTNRYTNFFPNLQTVFALGPLTNIRVAYSRSIGRPSFDQLNPSVLISVLPQTVERGNPYLDPMLSNNYDLLFEHYLMNVGQLSVGLFYKDMKDFVYQYSERIPEGETGPDSEYAGYRRVGYRNGEEATVYGFEFTWQQNLEFLPGFLGNLGTYFNYSYAQSIAELGRSTERSTHGLAELGEALGFNISDDYKYVTPLEGQRPHIINAGIDYQQGSFFTQVSYQWAAPSISAYGSNDRQWIALTNRPVYFDEYNDAAQNLSFTLRYWLSSNFQVWFDASNILNQKEVSYYYDRDTYPSETTLDAREITFGLRYKL